MIGDQWYHLLWFLVEFFWCQVAFVNVRPPRNSCKNWNMQTYCVGPTRRILPVLRLIKNYSPWVSAREFIFRIWVNGNIVLILYSVRFEHYRFTWQSISHCQQKPTNELFSFHTYAVIAEHMFFCFFAAVFFSYLSDSLCRSVNRHLALVIVSHIVCVRSNTDCAVPIHKKMDTLTCICRALDKLFMHHLFVLLFWIWYASDCDIVVWGTQNAYFIRLLVDPYKLISFLISFEFVVNHFSVADGFNRLSWKYFDSMFWWHGFRSIKSIFWNRKYVVEKNV